MNTLAIPKVSVSLETMRSFYRFAYRLAGLFLNLDAVENSVLNSRIIEYPFVLGTLAAARAGRVLDVGCADAGNLVAPTLASLGWQVHGIDIRDFSLPYAGFHFLRGDMTGGTGFDDCFFDCVYAVSSIEHFGISGRYGVREDDPEADFKAVHEVRRVLKRGAPFLLTVPYGVEGLVRPSERVYGPSRLGRLLDGWEVRRQIFWQLDERGQWHQVKERQAARTRTPGGVAVALLELAHD